MKKEKVFYPVRFDASILKQALEQFLSLDGKLPPAPLMNVKHDDGAVWSYDDLEEFFADYRRFPGDVHLYGAENNTSFQFRTSGSRSYLTVELPNRKFIEKVFEIFEDAAPGSMVQAPEDGLKIFIGHGRSEQWKLLRDHLRDHHGYDVVAYETGALAGHTIRDILEEMAAEATFAILVFTGEDQQAGGQMRARQNVVHEAGLFQGSLGFSRAIILLEEGVENLSNVDGIQYIPFSCGNIRESFGDVLATIRREFFT